MPNSAPKNPTIQLNHLPTFSGEGKRNTTIRANRTETAEMTKRSLGGEEG